VAREQGFCSSTLLLGADATIARVRSQLHAAAAASHPGDLFLITFSGHGGRRPVQAAVPCAVGALRGVWGLYDGSLDDADMHAALADFRPGVRVLVISDSCNGGVPAKADGALASDVTASVLVLSACREDRFADAPGLPGHFTTALLREWHRGERASGYRRFYESVAASMPEYQQPTYYWVGAPDTNFEAEAPFTV
jgi:hypothetical protein